MKLRELGPARGLDNYGGVVMAVRRYERKLARDAAGAERLNEITQMLYVDSAEKQGVSKRYLEARRSDS
jgi:hypothetical protein